MVSQSLITVAELAARLRVSKATAYALVNRGFIASLRVGAGRGVIRIRESDLHVYEQDARSQPAVKSAVVKSARIQLKHIKLK